MKLPNNKDGTDQPATASESKPKVTQNPNLNRRCAPSSGWQASDVRLRNAGDEWGTGEIFKSLSVDGVEVEQPADGTEQSAVAPKSKAEYKSTPKPGVEVRCP